MAKLGPLTREEMMQVWAAAVDKNYRAPLEDAGDGNGLEVYSQTAEQLARVSKAIDVTTQALYILPHSGQTNDPASGEQKATVTLAIARTKLIEHPLLLAAGTFVVEEETTDFGPNGPQTVHPGRLYVTTEDLVFHPGEMGPLPVACEAAIPGWSYNNPLPGTITHPVQVGSGFTRERATIVAPNYAFASIASEARGLLATINEADTLVPEHVGQYAILIAGANMGLLTRLAFFSAPPNPATHTGTVFAFDIIHAVAGTAFAGTFAVGEVVDIAGGTGFGVVLKATDSGGVRTLTFRFVAGTPVVAAAALLGVSSGATLTVAQTLATPVYASEAPIGGIGGAHWRVLDWTGDWGLVVANDAQPQGGKLGILDELGNERALSRAPRETDEAYRVRVATLADVVSPNAIKRALSRALGSIVPWVFRESGQALLPGAFFDGGNEAPDVAPGRANADTYDVDVFIYTGFQLSGAFLFQEACVVEDLAETYAAKGFVGGITAPSGPLQELTLIKRDGRPIAGGSYRVRGLSSGAIFQTIGVSVPATADARRFRRWLDYEQFRGYFVVEVARLGIGEFGWAYDVGRINAYDAGPSLAFFDGYPHGNSAIYLRAHQSVDQARAGGVGFHFEQTPQTFPTDLGSTPLVPRTMFGSDLVRWYYETYDGAGAWKDETGHFTTTQSDPTAQPAATTLPNGRPALSFDGTDGLQASPDDHALVIDAFKPWIMWGIASAGTIADFTAMMAQRYSTATSQGWNMGGSWDPGINGRIGFAGRSSINYGPGSYDNSIPHSIVVVGRWQAPQGFARIYVDGIDQGEVGMIFGMTSPDGPLSIGAGMLATTFAMQSFFTGLLANMGIAARETPFTTSEVSGLNRYLRWYGGTP